VAPLLGNDNRLPTTRLIVVSYICVAMILLLLVGFWKLQVVDSDHYQELAEKNRIRAIPLIAPRGKMLDREGRVIVDNYPSFSVLLLRDDMAQVQQELPQISDGLNVSIDDLKQQIEAAKWLPKYEPIVIKPEASTADIQFIESHRPDLPALEMVMVHRRRYPPNSFLASAIGYVGEVNEKEIEGSDGKLRPGDMTGKTGLEREYNDTLVGQDGMRRVIVNSVGKEMGRLEETEPVAGKNIKLTIDEDLQAVAEADFVGKEGALVAMDARTGEILAMVSRPTFDPNDFAVRIPPKEWAALNTDPQTPLLNRAIQAQLAPGSVFKVIEGVAMLESKAIPANYTAYCPGSATFYGHLYHCDHAHGEVDLHKGIVASCDVYFYNVAKLLGIDRIGFYATSLGLGKRTGIDLPGEEPGLIPSEAWDERVYHHKWYPGDTISVGIGQGPVTATPVQLARTIAAIASGGKLIAPHMLKNATGLKTAEFPISDDTVEQMTNAMWGVVNEPDGTTSLQVRLQDVDFAGKTGTAQTESYALQNRLGKHLKENGWFIGIAPHRNPEIVVAALVQGAGWGSFVAPIVRDVVRAYYDKKAGRFPVAAQAQTASAQAVEMETPADAMAAAAADLAMNKPGARASAAAAPAQPQQTAIAPAQPAIREPQRPELPHR
jgi:penicillin-binding protein 2